MNTATPLRVVQMQTEFHYSHRTHTWIQFFALLHNIRTYVADCSLTTPVSRIFKPTFRTSFSVYVLRIEKKKNYNKPNHLYISHPYIKITSQYIVTHIPVAVQRLSIHFPGNTQQQELCSLWTVLQLVARQRTNKRAFFITRYTCFLRGLCRGIIRGNRTEYRRVGRSTKE
jgi:hypothetical protein